MAEQESVDTTETLFARTRARRYRDWFRIGIYAMVIGIFAVFFLSGKLTRLEYMVFDVFQHYGGFTKMDPRIALVEITDETLGEIGAWPWPRRYFAIIARLLDQWGAAAVVFDFEFSGKTDPQDDQDLIQVLQNTRAPFFLPIDYREQKEKKFWVHGLPVVIGENKGKMIWSHSLPEIEKAVRGLGHHYLRKDEDGVLRRFLPYLNDDQDKIAYLGLLPTAELGQGSLAGGEGFKQFIEDDTGAVLIPWVMKKEGEFKKFDFADLIHSFYGVQRGLTPVVPPELVKGKICFVGLAAKSVTNFQQAPLGNEYAPIAVHAQVANGSLTGQWIRSVSRLSNFFLLVLVGVVAAIFFMVFRGAFSLLAGLCLGIGWVVAAFLAFKFFHIWFFSVHQAILISLLFVFSAIYVQMTVTRERSALFHLATRDGLTELYVIRHFRLIMNQIVKEASIRKEPLSMILLDIDHFKNINDTYGHPAGDSVLKTVAQTLVSQIRKKRPFSHVDFAARYGGEEFIIMLRKAGLKEAAENVAERLRKKVAATSFEWEGKSIPVTISLGVATLRSGENVPDPMVHRADAALYRAKETGRNKVCVERC